MSDHKAFIKSLLDTDLDDSKIEKINEEFKRRKEQIDKELSRIRKLLLDDSVTEVSLDIHVKFDKSNISNVWKHRSSPNSELTFTDQVKKEMK